MGFIKIIPYTSPKTFTSETTFSNSVLIGYAYSKHPKFYGMEIIITEEVMDKFDMFQTIFGKVYEFGWWDLERILSDAGSQFISTEFQY